MNKVHKTENNQIKTLEVLSSNNWAYVSIGLDLVWSMGLYATGDKFQTHSRIPF